MQQEIENLYEFVQDVKKNSKSFVRIDEIEAANLENFLELKTNSMHDPSIDSFVEFMEDIRGIKLNDEKKWIKYLRINLTWTREAQETGQFLLKGGCYFNGITDVISSKPTTFFEYSLDKFLKYEEESKTDINLIHKLRFIESPTSLQDATYTPYFGCVTLKEKEFPTDFYFYDSGLVYKLPFITYEGYIDALIQSAAVNCWQYFYVNPQEVIQKNKGIKYITWGLHTRTRLDEDLAGLNFVPDAKYDRLDLINEHLKQCVELLPDTFPFLNFEHHINYYNEFKKLYEASR